MLKNLFWLPLQRAMTLAICLMGFGNMPLCAQSAAEIAKLLASDGASGDSFGFSVDIDGDTAVVGAFLHDHQGTDSGAAYVFVRDGDTWVEQAELLPSDGKALDQAGFGQIAVDGDTILLGAHLQDVDGDTNAGVVYVFERNGNTWTETTKLHANDRQPGDQFGVHLALDGDTAIIGANGDDNPNGTNGSVYVYVRNGNTWTQQAILVGSDFGVRSLGFAEGQISIDEDTVVVGAWASAKQGRESGAAYVFVRNGNTWSEQAMLLPNDGKPLEQFGNATALDHDTLMVGACRCHDPSVEGGAVYVYTRNGSIWTQQAKLFPADGAPADNFGASIKIVGDRAVIGAPGARNNLDHFNEGAAYVFVRNDNTWTEQEKVLASDGEARDRFGVKVSMEGDSIVIGAWKETQNDPEGMDTGSAYIFELSPEFKINAAISDAWFFPDTAGQGFFIIVWEDSDLVFLAWFTYDTERPPQDVTADLGEPGQRWLTALGPFEGDTALLDVFLSSGMIFDSDEPPVTTEQLEGATIEIVWTDCKTGLVKYNIPTPGLMGEIPIERIVEDKVAACEAAQAQ